MAAVAVALGHVAKRFGARVAVDGLSLNVLRNGNAGRLDDVHDVDASARPDLDRIGRKLPVHVAGNDGGHDAALGAIHVFEN